MYLHFNMRRAKCLRYSDAGHFAEYYFTWRAYVDGTTQVQVAQGFSLGCPADDGYSMRNGEERPLNDPKFTVELPDVAEGETKRFVLDLFAFESDFGTMEVKKAFTNEAAAKVMELAEQANASKDKLLKDFTGWLASDNEVVKALVATGVLAASAVVPYVAIATAAVKALSWVVDAIRSNKDDLLGQCRVEILYTKVDGKRHYRWIFNDGASIWKDNEGEPFYQDWRAQEADGGNVIDCRFLVQIVAARPNELVKKVGPDAIPVNVAGLI